MRASFLRLWVLVCNVGVVAIALACGLFVIQPFVKVALSAVRAGAVAGAGDVLKAAVDTCATTEGCTAVTSSIQGSEPPGGRTFSNWHHYYFVIHVQATPSAYKVVNKISGQAVPPAAFNNVIYIRA